MFLLIAFFIGLIPATIAKGKGRSFLLWWIYGFLLFIVALPHALIMKADRKALDREAAAGGLMKCHACAEMIRDEAKVCRYCGRDQPAFG